MMEKKELIPFEIVKAARIIGLLTGFIILLFVYRKIPALFLFGGIGLAIFADQLLYFSLKRKSTLQIPFFYVQIFIYLALISMAIYFAGGLRSGLFLLYGLLLIYVAVSRRLSPLVVFILVVTLAYAGVTLPEWRNSPTNIGMISQRLILLFLISVTTSIFSRIIVGETVKLEKTKEDLLSTVSHELRAPLTSILGYVSLLLGGKAGALNEKQKTFLQSVLQQGKKLESLVTDILNAARPEVFLEEKEIKLFDLTKLIEEVVEKFQPVAMERNLHLKRELPDNILVVEGDPARIEQVLINLIDNSLKYTEKGEVSVSLEPRDREILVKVSDTGPGISEEHLPYVFEKFYQVDGSLDRAKGGTGLGLAIAQEIIMSRGGKIWVESELGKGTTFSFTLPVRRADEGRSKVRQRETIKQGARK